MTGLGIHASSVLRRNEWYWPPAWFDTFVDILMGLYNVNIPCSEAEDCVVFTGLFVVISLALIAGIWLC